MIRMLRLGVNIDHVATIRNARGGLHPDPIDAAHSSVRAGADGIVCHLREDRRHISELDLQRLMNEISLPLNLEMAATEEMLEIALRHQPPGVCIVPEKRKEVTTEGGLDVYSQKDHISEFVSTLSDQGMVVSLFVDPEIKQIDASIDVGATAIEIHTGSYCDSNTYAKRDWELKRIQETAEYGFNAGLEVRAGHGISYDTVSPIASITCINELNIGHFLIGESIFTGLESAISKMRRLMDEARQLSLEKNDYRL